MAKWPTIEEIDQEAAMVRDGLTAVYWALYSGCLERGFTEAQAMSILHIFIMKPSPPEDG